MCPMALNQGTYAVLSCCYLCVVLLFRSSSLTSELSTTSHFHDLVGWSYERTHRGLCDPQLKKEAYYNRYVNDRVEIELTEFQDEIRTKFHESKIKNFVFPRKNSNPYEKSGIKINSRIRK